MSSQHLRSKIWVTFGQIHKHTINGHKLDKDTVAEITTYLITDTAIICFLTTLFNNQYHRVYNNIEEIGLEYYSKGIFSF